MKIIITESQYRLLVNEVENVKTIRDVNIYKLLSDGSSNLRGQVREKFKIPQEFNEIVSSIISSLNDNYKEWVLDVQKGNLSPQTLQNLISNVVNKLIELSKKPIIKQTLQKIPDSSLKMVNTLVGRTLLKDKIKEIVDLIGRAYFVEGMIPSLDKIYNVNSPIVKNYKKVLSQLGTSVSNNQQLKDSLYNISLSLLK